MAKFNPLIHPICLSYPLRITPPTNGVRNIPAAMTLIDLSRPGLFVELGTTNGVLYCAFCQAVRELQLDCLCYGIGAWDVRNDEAFEDLKKHHAALYGNFSQFIDKGPSDALSDFENQSIDLLHLEG